MTELSAAKRALLEQRLRGRAAGDNAADSVRRPADAPVTLSPGQRRLWFLHQLAPASSAYAIFDALRLRGPIAPDRMRDALARVVLRHEVLRTRYETRDGRPFAIISPDAAIGFESIDLGGPADAREAAARERALRFIRQPFDLAAGPVVRAALIRIAEHDYLLVLAIHHIACDEWSLAIVWRELAAAYTDASPALEEPPVQYADFAHWQNRLAGSPSAAVHLEYWRRTLHGCPPPLQLPAERVPPSRRSFRGGIVAGRLGAETAAKLQALARSAGTTGFVLHLAAFIVLLHRYTAEVDIVVGSPATARGHPAFESAVGFFLNTLPVRVDASGDPAFTGLLRRVHDAFIDGIAHRDTPFEAMVRAAAPERALNRNPLFSAMFVEQADAAAVSFGDDVSATRVPLESCGAKFDLTLFAGERRDGVELMIEYDADRFDRAVAERMLEHVRTLLAGIAADPERPLSELPLVSVAERRRLDVWSRGPAPRPAEAVHARFRATARATGGRAAVVSDAETVTYEQLAARVRAIAGLLRARGTGANHFVGLCADRSADVIAGVLGILEAGAAYVPLDPEYPAARIAHAIRDTGARTVLASAAHRARVAGTGVTVLPLEAGGAAPAAAHADPAGSGGSLDGAAYVVHTSGSTGEPKGVLVTHRNLAYSTAARDAVYPDPPGVFMLLPSFAFDSSVAGIFWTLATGGTLALPPHRIEQDVHALAAFVARHAVTHTLCLPTLWDAVLEHAPIRLLRSLRTVIVAGEACSPRLVRRHHEALPTVALWNEYGPTEATVWCTVYRVPHDFDGATVPIGSPIAGAHVYVLDAGGAPAPVGVPGELWIGGAGIAAGYLNRPEETAARFVPDPFDAVPGARMYRTGDRARWRDDGLLEFLGRVDQQIKVRGYRIEPAEIEMMLRQHPAVREVHVAARTSAGPASPSTDVDRLVAALEAMDPQEAERVLAFVEHAAGLEVPS